MNTPDKVREDLMLLAELLLEARRRRPPSAAMYLALEVLVAAPGAVAALADLGACLVRVAHAARYHGDLETSAAFEMAAEITRAHVAADVAPRRPHSPVAATLGVPG